MKYQELLSLFEKLDEMGIDYCADVHPGQKVGRLWISGVPMTHEKYHPVVSLLTSTFERLDKEVSYGEQSWRADKDNTSLVMDNVAKCKVVGYRTVERPKTIEVETEEMETTEEPIYDCSATE